MAQLPENDSILGVTFKPLTTHPDSRGFFREVIRSTDTFFPDGSFAQWSHSKMEKNVVKAWHYHHIQTDWWYVGLGLLEVVLFDNREESPTYQTKLVFQLGETGDSSATVCIPPGVLHGGKVLSEFAHLFYITSKTYNPDDEGRFAYNSPVVDHEWGDGVIVSERDTVDFTPTHPRSSR